MSDYDKGIFVEHEYLDKLINLLNARKQDYSRLRTTLKSCEKYINIGGDGRKYHGNADIEIQQYFYELSLHLENIEADLENLSLFISSCSELTKMEDKNMSVSIDNMYDY